MKLQLTHTAAAGTVLEGTHRGDGTAAILKGAGWRWALSIAAWYLPRSRDRAPQASIIVRTVALLSDAGYTVDSEVDPTLRSAAAVEAARHERSTARVERLNTAADTSRERSETADARAHRISGGIPLGQPILLGHHSETRHRRDLAKIEAAQILSLEQQRRADELAAMATAAEAADAARVHPQMVTRRITTIDTQRRALQRSIDGHRNHLGDAFGPAVGERRLQLQQELAGADAQHAYWQGVRELQLQNGQALALDKEAVSAGDLVQYRGSWYQVIRANAKSVSVQSRVGGSWTDTIPYHQLTGHRKAQ